MSVILKCKTFFDSREAILYAILLVLGTLLIGYAPNSISIAIFLLVSIFSGVKNRRFEVDIYLILPMIIYSLFIFSLFWAEDDENVIKGLQRELSLVVIPLAFCMLPKFTKTESRKVLKNYTYINLLIAVFLLLVGTINFIKTKDISSITYHNLGAILDLNAIYISVFFALSYFYILSIPHKKIRHVLALFFIGGFILLLSSKMIVAIILLTTISYFIYNIRSGGKRNLTVSFLILILLFGSIIQFKEINKRINIETKSNIKEVFTKEKFGKTYNWTGTTIRLFQTRIFVEQLKKDKIFWTGFGLDNSQENIKQRQIDYSLYPGYYHYNYHNQYIQIFSEIGVFGFLMLVFMILISSLRSLKAKDFLFVMFNITCIGVFFSESFLWRQRGLVWVMVIYCLFNRTNSDELSSEAE